VVAFLSLWAHSVSAFHSQKSKKGAFQFQFPIQNNVLSCSVCAPLHQFPLAFTHIHVLCVLFLHPYHSFHLPLFLHSRTQWYICTSLNQFSLSLFTGTYLVRCLYTSVPVSTILIHMHVLSGLFVHLCTSFHYPYSQACTQWSVCTPLYQFPLSLFACTYLVRCLYTPAPVSTILIHMHVLSALFVHPCASFHYPYSHARTQWSVCTPLRQFPLSLFTCTYLIFCAHSEYESESR
jgi:hypothetical protein